MIPELNNIGLSVIIVNWNGEAFLPDCLKSIVKNPPCIPFEVIVVDNDSTDQSVEYLKSENVKNLFGSVPFKLIETGENLGFSRANNLAIEQTDSPFVFLLNPDTIVTSNAIDRLVKTLESSEDIGAVAPKLLEKDGRIQYSVWRFPPTPLSILTESFKLGNIIPGRFLGEWLYSSHWDYQKRTAVPSFSGAAIMAKREMIDKIGAFDSDFYMYGEDVEWCFRINKNGWKTIFEPEAEIYHLGGQSSVQRWGSSETRVKEQAGFLYCQSKCISKPWFFFNLLTSSSVLTLFYLKNLILGNDRETLRETLKLHLRWLKSFLKFGSEKSSGNYIN